MGTQWGFNGENIKRGNQFLNNVCKGIDYRMDYSMINGKTRCALMRQSGMTRGQALVTIWIFSDTTHDRTPDRAVPAETRHKQQGLRQGSAIDSPQRGNNWPTQKFFCT